MALLAPKVIAQVSGRSVGELGAMSWEWIMRADGQVFYRLTKVNGKRERNPWALSTRLPATELEAIRGDTRDPGEIDEDALELVELSVDPAKGLPEVGGGGLHLVRVPRRRATARSDPVGGSAGAKIPKAWR